MIRDLLTKIHKQLNTPKTKHALIGIKPYSEGNDIDHMNWVVWTFDEKTFEHVIWMYNDETNILSQPSRHALSGSYNDRTDYINAKKEFEQKGTPVGAH